MFVVARRISRFCRRSSAPSPSPSSSPLARTVSLLHRMASSQPASYTEYVTVAQEAAMQAGELVRAAVTTARVFLTKSSPVDLVTETDKKCEEFILSHLRKRYPTHRFIAEETAFDHPLTDEPTWIIDPVDGTTNFVHGFPFVVTAIGLSINKQIVAAVVYNALMEEMFTATLGGGAFLNGAPIRTSGAQNITGALISTNFGHHREPNFLSEHMMTIHRLLSYPCHGIRVSGAAAQSMCHLAAGRIDCFFEEGIKPWDVAAGSLIVREAGGVLSDPGRRTGFDFMNGRVIAAATPQLLDEMQKLLTKETA